MDALTDPQAQITLLERELGTASAAEVVDMVRSMEDQLTDLYRQKEISGDGELPEQYARVTKELYAFYLDRDQLKERYGVGSSEELVELIDSMDAQLAALYEEGSELQDAAAEAKRAKRTATKATASVERLHKELGTESPEDILALIQSMEEQLVELYKDRETTDRLLASSEDSDTFTQLQGLYAKLETVQRELGVSQIEDAVELVRSMEDQLSELYKEREIPADGEGDTATADALRRELGVSGLTEAASLVESMEAQLAELYKEKEALGAHGIADVDEALEMIDNMKEQLSELYRDREATTRALEMAEAGDPVQQLQQLYAKLDVLRTELGVNEPDEAVELVRSMEDQLSELYEDRATLTQAGMGSAQEILEVMQSMEEQLGSLYADLEAMSAAGFDDPAAALEVISSLEQQVVDLYQEKEAVLAARGRLVAEGTVPDNAVRGLDLIAAEVEKAHAFSGALAEMRSSLQTVLGELEAARKLEGELKAYETRLEEMEAEATDRAEQKLAAGRSLVSTIQNLQGQLDALYDEKRRMSEAGVADADEAVYLIGNLKRQLGELYTEKQRLVAAGLSDPEELLDLVQSMEDQLSDLYREREESENATSVLERELGVADPEAVVELVRTLRGQLETFHARAPESAAAESEAPLFADDDVITTLDALDDAPMSDRLVGIDYAVIAIDEQGTVAAFHEPDGELGGLDALETVGKGFFTEVAPSTNNRLFYGRYKRGLFDGALDTAFPYTFLHGADSDNLVVQIHRAKGATHSWILLRRA
ncbi:MAG: hypothetical protein AAF845_16650 [Bacteroidota bacterium]